MNYIRVFMDSQAAVAIAFNCLPRTASALTRAGAVRRTMPAAALMNLGFVRFRPLRLELEEPRGASNGLPTAAFDFCAFGLEDRVHLSDLHLTCLRGIRGPMAGESNKRLQSNGNVIKRGT